MKFLTLCGATCIAATTATAGVEVVFTESAPKDRFTITNTGACPIGNMTLDIDLGASAAGLILDVTAQGAGVNVYQPLELVAGESALASLPVVQDGDTVISLPLTSLGPKDAIIFTIDVDDTKGLGPTMISGAEITGAQIIARRGGQETTAAFDDAAVARLDLSGCNA